MMRPLTKRERHLLIGTAVLLMTLSAWIFLVSPMLMSRSDSPARIQKADAIADLLSSSDLAPGSTVDAAPLPSVLTRRAAQTRVSIRRLDPAGTSISASLDDAPFTDVMAWLAALTEEDGLRILSVEMGRRTAPGVVSTRVALEVAK